MRRLILCLLLLASPLGADAVAASPAAPATHPTRMMVVAADPLAAQAGLAILRAGGSALDAAVAVQMALSVVEPQSSGLGGGALLLWYDAASHQVAYYDGRESAPAAARPDQFLQPDGTPMPHLLAELNGRAVGVPGTVAMLAMAQHAHGHLPWRDLIQPAITLADQGFPVSTRLSAEITAEAATLRTNPEAARLFLPDGAPPAPGSQFHNPALADTLRRIATDGPAALYSGPIAADIARTVRATTPPGLMTADDLAAYRPVHREPVCGPYRGLTICAAAPPSAGGIEVLQTLGLLSHFDLAGLEPRGPDAAQLITEAERLALADRDRYLGDPDFVRMPVAGLLAPDYLALRSQEIDRDHTLPAPQPGNPSWDHPSLPMASQPAQPEHGTSDIAIVDAAGNAVAMTTTIEDEFGSRLLVDGFLLNNELTDFSFLPAIDGRKVANRLEPGKRPRSSMSPVVVLDAAGHLRAIAGSAGGSRIVGYVVQALAGVIDWGLDPARALALPHVGASDNGVEVEAGTPAAGLVPVLRARGQAVREATMRSGSALIVMTPDGPVGAADPRRDGVAAGE
jgi:gamma-glutamyltranspeptidase / glutathione hydrolase